MSNTVQPVVLRLGPNVTLICGDCADVLPIECDAIISDPPYGMGLTHGNRAKTAKQKDAHLWGKQWGTIAGDDEPFDPSPWLHAAVTVLWGANHYCAELPSGKKWLCWFKGTPEGMSYSDCELAWTSVDGGGVEMKSILWSGFRRET